MNGDTEAAIARFIIRLAKEVNCPWEEHGLGTTRDRRGGHNEIDYDIPDDPSTAEWWAFESGVTDDGKPFLDVNMEVTGTSSRKVLSATYNPPGKAHPAEYETEEHTIGVQIRWIPDRGGLDGAFRVTVEHL